MALRKDTLLVVDADNTLYDLSEFIGRYVRSISHIMRKEAGVAEAAVFEQLKSLFQARGSMEFRFISAHLATCNDLNDAQQARISKLLSIAYVRIQRRRLALYDGVESTLVELRNGGVKLVLASNAPFRTLEMRFNQIKIADLFAEIWCWDGLSPYSDDAEFSEALARRQKDAAIGGVPACLFSEADRKPSPAVFEQIRTRHGTGYDYWTIGDNIHGDLVPAAGVGYRTVWAEYGTAMDARNRESMVAVSPKAYIVGTSVEAFSPDHRIQSFGDLLAFLPYDRDRARSFNGTRADQLELGI